MSDSAPPPAPRAAAPTARLDVVDAARAAALLAMAAYHALWDLGALQLTPENLALAPAGRWAARLIAGSFLALVGVGLVLMNRDGVAWGPALRRVARIGAAALLVTLATWVATPDAYVFFGILHCIALSSLLALPFVRLPAWASLAAAAGVFALAALARHPWLEAPELFFLGLGRRLPETNDWVPLCPWFGIVLAGVGLGRLGLPALRGSRLGRWRARGRFARGATAAGRHSLLLYLVHQPLLFGGLAGLAALTGPHPQAGVAAFRAEFEAACVRSDRTAALCRAVGACTLDALRREGLWGVSGATPAQRAAAQRAVAACYAAHEGDAPPP